MSSEGKFIRATFPSWHVLINLRSRHSFTSVASAISVRARRGQGTTGPPVSCLSSRLAAVDVRRERSLPPRASPIMHSFTVWINVRRARGQRGRHTLRPTRLGERPSLPRCFDRREHPPSHCPRSTSLRFFPFFILCLCSYWTRRPVDFFAAQRLFPSCIPVLR